MVAFGKKFNFEEVLFFQFFVHRRTAMAWNFVISNGMIYDVRCDFNENRLILIRLRTRLNRQKEHLSLRPEKMSNHGSNRTLSLLKEFNMAECRKFLGEIDVEEFAFNFIFFIICCFYHTINMILCLIFFQN